MATIDAFRKHSTRVYAFDDGTGREIVYRLVGKADLPQSAWPIFNTALVAYLEYQKGSGETLSDTETAALERASSSLTEMSERDDANDIQVAIITAACVGPVVVDHRTVAEVPDEAIALCDIEQMHQDRLASAIIMASTGLDTMTSAEEAAEADAMACFRGEGDGVPGADGAVEADGDEAVGAA